MNKAMIRVTVILTAAVTLLCGLGLFVLGMLTAAFHYGMMDSTVHFSFILIGLALVVCSLPLCIYRIKQGNRLIDAIADPIAGVFLIFLGLGCELLQHLFLVLVQHFLQIYYAPYPEHHLQDCSVQLLLHVQFLLKTL